MKVETPEDARYMSISKLLKKHVKITLSQYDCRNMVAMPSNVTENSESNLRGIVASLKCVNSQDLIECADVHHDECVFQTIH